MGSTLALATIVSEGMYWDSGLGVKLTRPSITFVWNDTRASNVFMAMRYKITAKTNQNVHLKSYTKISSALFSRTTPPSIGNVDSDISKVLARVPI